MSHFLNASQLAEACAELEMDTELQLLETVSQMVAERIAKKLDIEIESNATTEPGFAGLCVGFGPKHEGQKCPDNLIEYDNGSDWAQGEFDDEAAS